LGHDHPFRGTPGSGTCLKIPFGKSETFTVTLMDYPIKFPGATAEGEVFENNSDTGNKKIIPSFKGVIVCSGMLFLQ